MFLGDSVTWQETFGMIIIVASGVLSGIRPVSIKKWFTKTSWPLTSKKESMMISIREQSYGLNVALYNEFTLDDFRQLEAALLESKQKIHLPDILLDLSMLKDFTIDMAMEQIKFLNQHENDFGRVAVITDDIWIKLGARLSSLLTNQHPKYFDDATKAQEWLLASNFKQ